MLEGHLLFEPSFDSLPPHLSLHQVLDLMEHAGEISVAERPTIVAYAQARWLAVVADF